MADRTDLARAYVQAQRQTSDEAARAIEDALTEDVSLKLPRTSVAGRQAVLQQLANLDVGRSFRQVEWSEPEAEGDAVRIAGKLPLVAPLGGYEIKLTFEAGGRIGSIEQQNLPAPPLPPSEVKLSDEMQDGINNAYAAGATMLFASVAPDGQPLLSLRGSAQAFSDTQIAFWARNAEGGTVSSLETNPKMSAFYRDTKTRSTLTFYGSAWVPKDERTRMTVYDNSPEVERLADPQVKGLGVIIDLDRVEGLWQGSRVRMQRGAATAK